MAILVASYNSSRGLMSIFIAYEKIYLIFLKDIFIYLAVWQNITLQVTPWLLVTMQVFINKKNSEKKIWMTIHSNKLPSIFGKVPQNITNLRNALRQNFDVRVDLQSIFQISSRSKTAQLMISLHYIPGFHCSAIQPEQYVGSKCTPFWISRGIHWTLFDPTVHRVSW